MQVNKAILAPRFYVIESLINTARFLLTPVHEKLRLPYQKLTDAKGLPLPEDIVAEPLKGLPAEQVLSMAAASCVASTNLGNAYEHTLRLLKYLESGHDVKLKSGQKHKLSKLYLELSEPLSNKLDAIVKAIDSADVQLEVSIGAYTRPPADPPLTNDWPGFAAMLESWDRTTPMHTQHYMFLEATPGNKSRVRVAIPYLSLHVLGRILREVLAPAIQAIVKE